MAKTVLNSVNEILKRVNKIDSQNELASLTDSARQTDVDVAVQVISEGVDSLYNLVAEPFPNETAEATLTLVTDDRDYALASDLIVLRYPLIQETDGRIISEYPGGFEKLRADQVIPANHTGQPTLAAIRPADGQLYLNTIPTANENGEQYKYIYDKEIDLSAAATTLPFSDMVFRAMVPAWVRLWRLSRQNDAVRGATATTDPEYRRNLARAASLVSQKQRRSYWTPQSNIGVNITDPFEPTTASDLGIM